MLQCSVQGKYLVRCIFDTVVTASPFAALLAATLAMLSRRNSKRMNDVMAGEPPDGG